MYLWKARVQRRRFQPSLSIRRARSTDRTDFAALLGITSFDLFKLLPISCFYDVDLLDKMITSVSAPVIVVTVGFLLRSTVMRGWTIVSPTAFYVFLGCLEKRVECRSARQRKAGELITTPSAHARTPQYFVYAPVSLNTMLTFRCKGFDDGREVIESDMQVSCLDERYLAIRNSFGVAGLVLFALAPGALFLWVLWPHRAILKKPEHLRTEEEKQLVEPTAFLHGSYRPGCWWFESYEIWRRLVMCGALAIWFDRATTTGRLLVVCGWEWGWWLVRGTVCG